MKRVALDKASDHLAQASAAIVGMKDAADFKTYEHAWTEFLAQAGRFYSKIEQGAKGCKVSEPWFGSKKHERKSDPLLSYIHHARNCEEHTIEHTASMAADALAGKMTDGAFTVSFKFMVDDKGQQHYRDIKYTGPNGEDLPFELVNAKLVLLTVHDRRFGDKFTPPTIHLTRPIVDASPMGVAKLAISYLKTMLDQAQKLPLRY